DGAATTFGGPGPGWVPPPGGGRLRGVEPRAQLGAGRVSHRLDEPGGGGEGARRGSGRLRRRRLRRARPLPGPVVSTGHEGAALPRRPPTGAVAFRPRRRFVERRASAPARPPALARRRPRPGPLETWSPL